MQSCVAVLRKQHSLVRIHRWKEKLMSTITPKNPLMAEEFLLLPDPEDGSQQELVRGEIMTMRPPGGLHGIICSKVDRKIGDFVDAGPGSTVACNDTGFITEPD